MALIVLKINNEIKIRIQKKNIYRKEAWVKCVCVCKYVYVKLYIEINYYFRIKIKFS